MLPGYPGNCSRLHGHSYLLEVTVDGPQEHSGPFSGMVLDFAILSSVVKEEIISVWDHHFLSARQHEPHAKALLSFDYKLLNDLVVLDIERTTAENLARLIFDLVEVGLKKKQVTGVHIKKVTLWETTTGSATYERV